MPCDGRDGTDERPGGDESGDGCPGRWCVSAINNYYASSLNPEKELAEAFASKEVLAVAGAGQTGVAGGAQTAKPAQVPAETKAQPKETTGETEAVVRAMSKSIYDNIAISRVTNYVNVRAQASTSSEVVGKIYNNCAATILDTVDGEGGNGTISSRGP